MSTRKGWVGIAIAPRSHCEPPLATTTRAKERADRRLWFFLHEAIGVPDASALVEGRARVFDQLGDRVAYDFIALARVEDRVNAGTRGCEAR